MFRTMYFPHPAVVLLVVVTLSLLGVVTADSGAAIDHTGDGFVLDAVDGEHAHGTTSFMPGTFVDIRVKFVDDIHLFLVSKAVYAGENGSFGVMFNLSEMA